MDNQFPNYDNNQNIQYNNFQEINYNQEFQKEKKPFPIKIILFILLGIVFLGIVGFLVYNFLIKDRNVDNNQDSNFNNSLISSARKYYIINQDMLPEVYGACNNVSITTLIDNNLIEEELLNEINSYDCDKNNTSIKVCKLESGNYHYNVIPSCNKYVVNYGNWNVGNENNLISDSSDVRFTFNINKTKVSSDIQNIKNEEYFEDEIPYEKGTYTVVGKKILYRYRDKTYKWYSETDYYYPNNETNKNKVNQYYVSIPNSSYNKKGESALVYRWYTSEVELYNNGEYVSEAVGSYTIRGKEGTSITRATTIKPEQKSYRTIKEGYIYRKRELASTDKLASVDYYCINESTGRKWINSGTPWVSNGNPCNDSNSNEVGTSKIYKYMCYWINDKTGAKTKSESWKNDACSDKYNFVNANINDGFSTNWQVDNCGYKAGAEPYLCDRTSGYIYTDRVWQWSTPSSKVYLTHGSDKVTYYRLAPTTKAIKDTTTEVNGYKWYKTVTNILGYYKTAPSSNAKKLEGSDSWTSWSDYSISNVASSSTREVEQKTKLIIKKTGTDNTNWENITDGYVSLDIAIDKVNALGYKVETLKDILELSNFEYEVKLEYRNIKN